MKIELSLLSDNDPLLDQSKLLRGFEKTIEYAEANDGIGLTKSKAYNRKFATWAAENFDWPEYSAEQLLRVQKVLNEEDVPPVMVIHDLMQMMKLGRHIKGKFLLSKKAKSISASRARLFAELAATYPFQYNHALTSRFEFIALGNWDIFLNVINVEAQQGLTEEHLIKTLFGIERPERAVDRDYYLHADFVISHVLRPLCWVGFLEVVRETHGSLARPVYWKTPLWNKCLKLETDRQLKQPTLN